MKFFDSIYKIDFDKKDLRIGRYFVLIFAGIAALLIYALFFINLVEKVEVSGTIVPYTYHDVYARVEGRLKQVYKTDGESVSKNDLILELENDEIVKEYFNAYNHLHIKQRENMRLIPEVTCSRVEKQIAENELKMAETQFQYATENYNALKITASFEEETAAKLILAIDPSIIGQNISKNQMLCILDQTPSKWKILTHVSDRDIHSIDSTSVAQIKTPMMHNNEKTEFNGSVMKIYLYKTEKGYPVEIKANTALTPPLFSTTSVKIIGKSRKVYEYILYELIQ